MSPMALIAIAVVAYFALSKRTSALPPSAVSASTPTSGNAALNAIMQALGKGTGKGGGGGLPGVSGFTPMAPNPLQNLGIGPTVIQPDPIFFADQNANAAASAISASDANSWLSNIAAPGTPIDNVLGLSTSGIDGPSYSPPQVDTLTSDGVPDYIDPVVNSGSTDIPDMSSITGDASSFDSTGTYFA